ncbi:hypothetical protein F5146DRAFT_1006930 [Armillaria mellea]|nr:hypothetical protein F5146DRAFT_1006930 [Armillaria mellea]
MSVPGVFGVQDYLFRTSTLALPSSSIRSFYFSVLPSSPKSSSLERPLHRNIVLNLHQDIPLPCKQDVGVPEDGNESGQQRRIQNIWDPYPDVEPRTIVSFSALNQDLLASHIFYVPFSYPSSPTNRPKVVHIEYINTLSSWPAQPDLLPLTMATLRIEVECSRYDWHARVMTWLTGSLSGAIRPIMTETLTLVIVYPGFHDGVYIKLEDLAIQFSMLDEILTGADMKVFRRLKELFKQYADSPASGEASYFINWVHEKLQRLDKRNMLDVDVRYTS